MAITGYQKVGIAVTEGRALEAMALTRCAKMLAAVIGSTDLQATEQAVTLNQRLWLVFYSEIESGRVKLPNDVANNIISLVAYVVKMAPRAYAGERAILEIADFDQPQHRGRTDGRCRRRRADQPAGVPRPNRINLFRVGVSTKGETHVEHHYHGNHGEWRQRMAEVHV